MSGAPLTDKDARDLGWPNLQALADYVTARMGANDPTTKKAMEKNPDAWRNAAELKRHVD